MGYSFFNQIQSIIETERIQLSEKKARGELFNIFEVLGMTSNEVRTHSSFIAELLRPNGSHGMGSTPLSLFIQVINNRVCDFDFEVNGASVLVEQSIGQISDSYVEGGRLDILVESCGKAILIENKVFAKDQEKQLIRYFNYAEKQYKDFILLYLNREKGVLASPSSSESESTKLKAREHYWPISYEIEIQTWIRMCLLESFNKPLVRETLNQYLSLILNLTNNMETRNEEVIQKMMENPSVVTKILRLQDEYKLKVIKERLVKSFERFANDNDLEMEIGPGFLEGKRYSRLALWKKEWKNAAIVIKPDNHQSNYWIGILHKKEGELLKTTEQTFSMLGDGTKAEYPFGSKWLPGNYRWLFDAGTIEDIISGTFIQVIGNLINEILKETDSIPGFADL